MLEILRAGLMLTVQDQGRPGLLQYGVSASGPMDEVRLAIANALVGNPPQAAVLEFAAFGGDFRASRDVLVAVVAPGCSTRAGNATLPPGESRMLRAGEVLSVGHLTGGVWGYIAFSGGIDTPPILGSRSTHLRSRLGGLEGRTLKAGDRLALGPAVSVTARACSAVADLQVGTIRVIAGPQHEYFDAEAFKLLCGAEFSVTSHSDRMGMVLAGPKLSTSRGHDIISDATAFGSIQVPGSGMLTILLAERQPTGGYPKIATVASADLPKLVQLAPGSRLRFALIDQSEAEDLLIAERAMLRRVLATVAPAETLGERLMSRNLISGVWPSAYLGSFVK